MFIERRLHNGVVELWECEWGTSPSGANQKNFIRFIGAEQPLKVDKNSTTTQAICWSYGRTLGNIAVFNQAVIGSFGSLDTGDNAILNCDFVDAGKYRNGANRWWCRTHQSHWGVLADFSAYHTSGRMICSNANQPMSFVRNPFQLNMEDFLEVGVWCSLPPALTSTNQTIRRPPKIHVHIRNTVNGVKLVDQDFEAIAVNYNQNLGLFNASDITQVNVTPPAAFEFLLSLERGLPTSCINCSFCGYPHLDLGRFSLVPHTKHLCGNCGRDSTWSKTAINSTPLRPLHDQFHQANSYVTPDRVLNLDVYAAAGHHFAIWASTPAIFWTANRPQEYGIHVHVSSKDGSGLVIDDTYKDVILNGQYLDRAMLFERMVHNTIA